MWLSISVDSCNAKSACARNNCAWRHPEVHATRQRHCKFLLREGYSLNTVSFRRCMSSVQCESQLKLLSTGSDACRNKHMHPKKLDGWVLLKRDEENIDIFAAEDKFIWEPNGTVMVDLKPRPAFENLAMYAPDVSQDSSSNGNIQNSIFQDDGIEMGKHYEKMIGEDPRNPMLLRNYGHYLQQFKGDLMGAEKCYLPALLLDPENGPYLAEYAAITWELYHAESITKYFFERAVKSSSDDSFVHAAYARFLFQTENDDD